MIARMTLALMDWEGRALQQLPPGLLREALSALPDDTPEALKRQLHQWSGANPSPAPDTNSPAFIDPQDIHQASLTLAALAHLSTAARSMTSFPYPRAGEIINASDAEQELAPISPLVVLALALRALLEERSVDTCIGCVEEEF